MGYWARYLDPATMTVREERIEAQDEAAARRQMTARHGQLLSLTPAAPWRLSALWRAGKPRLRGRSTAEVALLCRELNALTGAGLSVVEALDALALHHRGPQTADTSIYAALLARLQLGRSLSAAMADVGGFPALLIASVQSSERTSHLGEAFDAYLRYDEMVGTLQRRVISAALYPAIVMGLGALVTVFLLWVVIPRFAVLYGQMGQGADGVTGVLLGLSRVLHESPWALPLGMLALVVLLLWGASGRRWQAASLWVAMQVPMLALQVRHFELTRLFEALALLTRGGFSLHESLALCSALATTPQARLRIEGMRQLIARGVSVSRAGATAGLTDSVTERLLRASERGGDFASVLQAISRRHASAFETFVERATQVVEPLLLLTVALLVGGTVVMLYMPIFDIAASIR